MSLPSTDQPVWLGMNQAALDAAYDQGAYAANMHEVLAGFTALSEQVRADLGPPVRQVYGDTPAEALDWYPAQGSDAPIHIFIHGGSWRTGSAAQYGFPAGLVVPRGIHCVVPDFVSVLDTDGDLMPLAEQVKRAIAHVARTAAGMGASPDRIHVSAHSSGAHLAMCAALTDWPREFDLPADVIKSLVLCGGIYDLEPVMMSSRSRYLRMPASTLETLSPQRRLRRLPMPIALAYGEKETPEFQRHSIDFAEALGAAGNTVTIARADAMNHFEILNTLMTPDGLLGKAVLDAMASHRPA